jgi:hypothetical protein
VLSTPIKSTCTLGLRDPRGSLRKGEKAGAQEHSCYSRNILAVLQDAFVLDYEARPPSVDGGNATVRLQNFLHLGLQNVQHRTKLNEVKKS